MAKQGIGNKNSRKSQLSQNIRSRKYIIAKNGVKNRLSTTKPQDARQKIIQKKRKTVVDARDILARMAKTQDARTKINKIRDGRNEKGFKSPNVKVIGSNILRKTDRNGKISLVTNRTNVKSDINVAIQKQLGLIPNRSPLRRASSKRSPTANAVRNPVSIRKTIINDMDYNVAAVDPTRIYEPGLYKWTRPELRNNAASQMINSLETTRQVMRETLREELSNGWPTFATHKTFSRPVRLQPRPAYIDLDAIEDEEMPLVVTPPRRSIAMHSPPRSSNIRSRLDGAPAPHRPESHGIFAKGKIAVMPAGHRIVVSNLQTTVTQDDIKELFEDIGELLSAKLVRPGVAEVIYKNLKDAQKAVDTYHNRQLDGQPMKCLLVNKRPLNQPTALPITKTESISASRKIPAIPPCPPSNKLIPDISTIHKVLFQRK